MTLTADSLPANVFGLFLVSSQQGFVQNPTGSSGNLCLAGAIGRFTAPGQIQNSGPGGTISVEVDLASIPQPTGSVSTSVGDTWNFQAWYRDSSPMGPTANFTNGLEITFN